jgi:heptosyltransferase-2
MIILIIQTAFLGDVILTTPVVEILKKHRPNDDIDFLTIPPSSNLVETNPHLRQVIVFDKRGKDSGFGGLKRIGRRLFENQYDICITPHRSWRSAYLSKKTQAQIRIGFDRSAKVSAFTHVQHYDNNLHEIERNLALLNPLKLNPSIHPPSIYPTDEDMLMVDEKIRHSTKPLFALSPGSIWPTKRWPVEYFTEMCGRLSEKGYIPILIGADSDRDLCIQISKVSNKAVSTAGDFSLRQTYCLLTKCHGLITNDSAPLHLAMAAGIPVFAIFGATVPAFGFAPFGEKSNIIENKLLQCRPCGIHGGFKCPTKTFDCMISIHPDILENVIFDVKLKHT